jgi:pimeloyl-ACP methyl ester carboxylesterase/DNA-binding SARP family transcriptional activator
LVPLKVQVTGRLRLEGSNRTVEATDFPGRQGRIAFASLLVAAHAVDRAALADRIWGDDLPPAWERHLSAVMSKLRGLLGSVDDGKSAHIRALAGAYELELPEETEVDLHRAEGAVQVMERGLQEDHEVDPTTIQLAVETLARPFLPGESGAWVEAVRLDMRALYVRALEAAADIRARSGNAAGAVELAQEVIGLEPFRETAHRRLMRLHLEAGDRAEAVRTYEHCRRVLAEELGVDPAPETHDLYISALRDKQSAPPDAVSRATEPPDASPTHYTRNGNVHIAYQVFGRGQIDVLVVFGWVYPMEEIWAFGPAGLLYRRLADVARVIAFDKRGTGLSDRTADLPILDERMNDIRAVLRSARSQQCVILAISEGGPMAVQFAVEHPHRVQGLVLYGTYARMGRAENHPWGWPESQSERLLHYIESGWGAGASVRGVSPSAADDPTFVRWAARVERRGASPGAALNLLRTSLGDDVRPFLKQLRVPTLVIHQRDDHVIDVGQGRYLAENIPDARYVELPGSDHWPLSDPAKPEMDAILDAVERFVAEVGRAQ